MCKTVKHINQWYSWHVLGFNTCRFGKLIADWSAKKYEPDVTSYGLSLYVRVLPRNKIGYNKPIILIVL